MRGRFHYISKRYSQVSNKYLKSYDPNQESKRSIYLYGYAVSTHPSAIKFVPDYHTSHEICDKSLDTCPFEFDSVTDLYITLRNLQ